MSNRKPLYAKIAIARKQLGMSDVIYRELLQNEFKVESSTKLSFHNLTRLVQILARLGADFSSSTLKKTPKSAKPQSRSEWIEIPDNAPYASTKKAICAIWRKLGYDLNSLDTRVKRAFNIDLFIWLQDHEQLKAMLTDLQKREKSFEAKQKAMA